MDAPTAIDPSAPRPAPADDEVEVWWADIDLLPETLDALRADLDVATTDLLELLVRPDDRRRGTVAHALLRRRCARLLGVAPRDVRITRRCAVCGATDHGKPAVDAPGGLEPPQVNLAHSGSLVVVGLTSRTPIGVDVEVVRPGMNWERPRRLVFAEDEWDTTALDPDPDRERLAMWTRKEAAAKVTGLGIAVGLERVAVGPSPPEDEWRPVVLPDELAPLLVTDLDLDAGHAAAVSVDASLRSPRLTVHRAAF
ncbi:MAG: 4'-phosphopantetheinyl transferase superfamily protein [Solirubrobacteraceae bacterium]|nr:4'-phosphopantetheinyl transferase superfamily protein [Solirubrobacteraceae bacterium]